MRDRKKFRILDTHTEGEPTRILIRDSLPQGASNAVEAREVFKRNYSDLKDSILLEPRGHRDQFGSVVYPSPGNDTDFTIFFTTTSGYLDMCAHATIGTSTALVYKGLVDIEEPDTAIRYDTPAGKVRAMVHVREGEAESVSIRNVPSFYMGRKKVRVPDPVNDEISVDLTFGGNFYAIVRSEDLSLDVDSGFIDQLRAAGKAISLAVHEQVKPRHPEMEGISPLPLTMITGKPKIADENYRNIVVFPNGSFDRSPCGTGTSARSALLYSTGELSIGDSFTHESITDTTFKCKITGETKVGPYKAVLPEITGRAWVTQESEIIIDPTDPLRHGFLIT